MNVRPVAHAMPRAAVDVRPIVFNTSPRLMLNNGATSAPLVLNSERRYSGPVAETTAHRGDSRQMQKADNRLSAVFLRPHTKRLLWSGLGGGAFALAGFLLRRSVNFANGPATPFDSGGRVIQSAKGGRTMRPISARPEQTQSPLEIIRAALRAAALAPSDRDALDATGDALRRLADMARAEVLS